MLSNLLDFKFYTKVADPANVVLSISKVIVFFLFTINEDFNWGSPVSLVAKAC